MPLNLSYHLTRAARHSPEAPAILRGDVEQNYAWLDDRGYAALDDLKGSMSYARVENSADFERAHYIYGLTHYQGGAQHSSD